MKKIILGLIGVILMLSLVGCEDTAEDKKNDLTANIVTLSQTAVEKNLKSPATAKFPASFEEYKIKEVASGKDDLKEYAVDGYVDAENSFGAKIRNRFIVKLQMKNDSEEYKILDVKIMEE